VGVHDAKTLSPGHDGAVSQDLSRRDADAAMTSEDRRAIVEAVESWTAAWENGDWRPATQHYAEDADWTNAFGVTCTSRAELDATLAQILSLPHVMAGRDDVGGHEIRSVGPDVVLVTTRIERSGQLTRSGQPLGRRQTTHLRVFARSDGDWKIVSHLISDARASQRPQH
jgi:uncharacterized protein (TIGR02246 family)